MTAHPHPHGYPVLVIHENGKQDIVQSYEPSDQGATIECSIFAEHDCDAWSL